MRVISRALVVVAVLAGFVVGAGVEAHAAAGCSPYEFIAARGSGESADSTELNMGQLMFRTFSELQVDLGADQISGYGVTFPAVGLTDGWTDWLNAAGAVTHIKPLGAYTDSVRAGTKDVQDHMNLTHAACPGTRFILGGYSQGAQAVGDALQGAGDMQSMVAGAIFYGDPYFNSRSWSAFGTFKPDHYGGLGLRGEWPDSLKGRVVSDCHRYDPVCNGSVKWTVGVAGFNIADVYVRDIGQVTAHGFAEHVNYVTNKDYKDAADSLARSLGQSVTSTSSVPLDAVFAIDTTGSMVSTIEQVKANVSALATSVAAAVPDYRFALVDYKDFGDPYQAKVDVGFTTDVAAFQSAVNTLRASGGGDTPESVYSGVMTALGLPWRNGVKKVVIPIGDAPPHDPESGTGYTAADVIARAFAVDPAQISPLLVGTDPSAEAAFRSLAASTSGTFNSAADTSTVASSLIAAVVNAGRAPAANAGGPYVATTGQSIALSGAGSIDNAGSIGSFEWNFGDGSPVAAGASQVVDHSYATAGTYDVTLKVTSSSGLSAVASTQVVVADAQVQAAPGAPLGLTATPGDASITLNWQMGSGTAPYGYVVRSQDGSVLDVVVAGSDGNPAGPWTDSPLAPGQRMYSVSAITQAGLEGPSASVASAPLQTPATSGAVKITLSGATSASATGTIGRDSLGTTKIGARISLLHGSAKVAGADGRPFKVSFVSPSVSARCCATVLVEATAPTYHLAAVAIGAGAITRADSNGMTTFTINGTGVEGRGKKTRVNLVVSVPTPWL